MPEHKGSSYAGRREKGAEPAGESQSPDGDKRAAIKEIKICLFGLGDELPWDTRTVFAFYSCFDSYLLAQRRSARGEPLSLRLSPSPLLPAPFPIPLIRAGDRKIPVERKRWVLCARVCPDRPIEQPYLVFAYLGLLLKKKKKKRKNVGTRARGS